jgi:hypothetical protein
MGAAGKSEEATVSEYVSVFRVRVPDESVARLLELHSGAIAEAQRLCPELVRAELVRLDDGAWLHVLTWSRADAEQRLMDRAAEFDAVTKLHELLADDAGEEPMRGEILHTAP